MAQKKTDAQALKIAKVLKNANNWKTHATLTDEGYYNLQTEDTGDVPVRLFLTPALLAEVEDILYRHPL
ncbi:MAG: hypothetical protein H0T92_13670 [Pyrinomonadaceae bacterium]|nr:hypothetical protein [Pyrinomonadaceae bacterium]